MSLSGGSPGFSAAGTRPDPLRPDEENDKNGQVDGVRGKAELAGHARDEKERIGQIETEQNGNEAGEKVEVVDRFREKKGAAHTSEDSSIKDLAQDRIGNTENAGARGEDNAGAGALAHAAERGDPACIRPNPTIGNSGKIGREQESDDRKCRQQK